MLLLAAVMLVVSTPGPVAENALAVVPVIVDGEHGHATISSIYDDVASSVARVIGLRLISSEEMFAHDSGATTRVLDCGAEVMCLADRLRGFDARLGLVVVVNLRDQPPLVALRLVDTEARRMLADAVGPLDAGESDVSSAIRSRVSTLLASAGHPIAARVVVKPMPANAVVSIAGVMPERGSTNAFRIPPGRYIVKGTLDGFVSRAIEIDATSGADIDVSMMLEPESSIFASPWLWAIVGAVVLAGTTTAVIIATEPSRRCVCFEEPCTRC